MPTLTTIIINVLEPFAPHFCQERTWQHINFHGRYKFNRPPVVIDVPDLVRQLAELDIALIDE